MIELNKEYSYIELAKILEISPHTLKKYREKYEQHLELFYYYEKKTGDRGKILYIFHKQYEECAWVDADSIL